MAYIDKRTGRNQRATVMIAVALIQGAAIIALINGLAVKFIDRPEQIRTSGAQIPIQPPPEPIKPKVIDPPKTSEPITHPTTTTIPLTGSPYNPPVEFPFIPPVGDGPVGEIKLTPPAEPAKPIPPRPAKPRGKPGDWVTANDYPARDLREGNQGVTGFRLSIGADGRAQSCAITHSSGFASLDEATCRLLLRRARFDPATNGGGNATASEYANNIRWVIPE